VTFASPVTIQPGVEYVVGYLAPQGHYADTSSLWLVNGVFSPSFNGQQVDAPPLHAPKTGAEANGVYAYGSGLQFPASNGGGTNYWVDLIFDDHGPVDTIPPTVLNTTPAAGALYALTDRPISAQFSEPIQGSTIQWSLKTGGNTVAGTAAYDVTRHVASFSPTSPLTLDTTYSVTLSGAKDLGGNSMAPLSWSFNTAASSGGCPCTLFNGVAVPASALSSEAAEIELGVRIQPTQTGLITALRFYKGPQNTGTHTATLWSSTGQSLATATFTYETGSGWQQVDLPTPVQVVAGQTYVASYHTTTGFYAFTGQGFATDVGSGLLKAPASTSLAGNGVFSYGVHAFPTNTWNATNYWVDAVFVLPPDTTPPSVVTSLPHDGATGVSTATSPSAVMSEPLQAGTVAMSVTDGGGNPVAGTVSYNASTVTVKFTPSAPLAQSTHYTVSLSGAKDLTGNAMTTPTTWSFTTSGTCPCSLFEDGYVPPVAAHSDTGAVELGVQFTSDKNGWIAGVRFYKGTGNTGTHTGSLWSASGQLLASGTFTGESTSGWQSLTFDAAVPITAGTTYLASYYAPNGHYATDAGLFATTVDNAPLHGQSAVFEYGPGGHYPSHLSTTGYGFDVTLLTSTPVDVKAPHVTSTAPAGGSTGAIPSGLLRATLSEPLQSGAGTISVTGPGGVTAGTTSLDPATSTFTWTPASYLGYATLYTAKLSGATDVAGNVMPDYSWTFTTAAAATGCPCSAWPDTAVPSQVSVNDPNPYELGIKVRFDTATQVTGIRFYKGPLNTGTHTGSLWAADGSLLAQATFTAETASGWQTVTFASPVTVQPGVTYTASYHTDAGMYSADSNAFATAGVDHGPLHVLRAGVDGSNGVYAAGASRIPTGASSANYWVDVTYAGPDTTAPTISGVSATGSGTTATVTWATNEASTSVVSYGTSPTTLNLSANTAGLTTTHSVTLTGLTANTRYSYRVTSADAAGNSATSPLAANSPASYVPTVAAVVSTSISDFSSGTQSNTYVGDSAGGEILLNATVHTEFTGAAVPTGWATIVNGAGGKATVANNIVAIDGAQVDTTTTRAGAQALDAGAIFGVAAGQSLGLGTTLGAGTPWALFTTRNGNELVASTRVGTSLIETVLDKALLGAEHAFRVDFSATAVTYGVDGVVVATHPLVTAVGLRPVLSDATVGADTLSVDWVRLSAYPASGIFTSAVVDAAAPVVWGAANWTATIPPAGGTLTFQVRTGPTAIPGASWSAFTTIAQGASIARTARYLQYRVTLTAPTDRRSSPILADATLNFAVV
jgi:Domain of unknown function (DUF4082)/Bacterial Ig-like domain/Purple acid Phosphatase, N-terminal domain